MLGKTHERRLSKWTICLLHNTSLLESVCQHAAEYSGRERSRADVRVQATGLWAQLAAAKAVVSEPRGTGDEFDGVMAEFYRGVRDGRGCLFFAVCRGKARVR